MELRPVIGLRREWALPRSRPWRIGFGMSKRLDPSWVVTQSVENAQHDHSVDVFARPDGSFGFEEFRRDPEDAGAWTPVSYFSGLRYASQGEALAQAARRVAWLAASTAQVQ